MSTAFGFNKGFSGAFGKSVSDSPFSPGNQFEDGISIEEAAHLGGLDFTVKACPSLYMFNGSLQASGEKTLYRADTGDFLSTMSEGYKVVQPMEILETHRKVLDAGGYHLRSAGVFKNGARFWSMAEGQGELTLKGEDRVKSYLFMASAVDGSSSTYAIGTNVRMVCWNKAPQVMLDGKNTARFIRVTHSQLFDADEARIQIQSNDEIFKLWSEDARELSETRLKVDDALMYFTDVFAVGKDEEDVQDKLEAGLDNKRVKLCLELFCGAGKGAELDSANGTLWGAYNAVTEFVDHHSGSLSVENRFASAMAGNGHRIKTTAWNAARNIVTGRRM